MLSLLLLAIAAVDPEVAEGLELYRALKYDRAVVVLGGALARSDLGEQDRRDALETLGFAYTVLGDELNAELTFHALLDREPRYQVDTHLSPRLRSSFARAKGSWVEGREIKFDLTSPLDQREITGRLTGGDPRRVGAVTSRDEAGKNAPLYCKERACRGVRPDETFFVDVQDHAGTQLSTSGPFEPLAVDSNETPWWIYGAIALGVLGGGIAVTLAVSASGADEPPNGSLGRLQLP